MKTQGWAVGEKGVNLFDKSLKMHRNQSLTQTRPTSRGVCDISDRMQAAYCSKQGDQRMHDSGSAVFDGVAAVDDVRHSDVPARVHERSKNGENKKSFYIQEHADKARSEDAPAAASDAAGAHSCWNTARAQSKAQRRAGRGTAKDCEPARTEANEVINTEALLNLRLLQQDTAAPPHRQITASTDFSRVLRRCCHLGPQ